MSDKEQLIKEEIERRIQNLSLILNIGNTEDLTKEEEYCYRVQLETLKSLLIFINSLEYPSPKFKIGNTIRDKEGKTGAFTITDIKVEDKSLVYLGNKRQKVSIRCQDDYEIVNNDLLVKENPASKDLIEEIDKIWKTCNPIDEGMGVETANIHIEQFDAIARHFAEWQKQKDQETIELAEEHAMLAGMEKMREEMMKDAVEGEIVYQVGSAEIAPTDIRYKVVSDRVYIPNVKLGDKVKIIIVKED